MGIFNLGTKKKQNNQRVFGDIKMFGEKLNAKKTVEPNLLCSKNMVPKVAPIGITRVCFQVRQEGPEEFFEKWTFQCEVCDLEEKRSL